MARVWAESKQSGSLLMMLLAIADFADDDGYAWPSVRTLATKCRMQLRNAQALLATLRRSGAPYALTPTELYEATMVTSGAMTARLDRLEKAGLTQRAPHPSDRRGVVVQLTEKGLELTDTALTAHVANEHEILTGLTQEDREMLAKLLEKLIGSLSSPS